MSKSLTRLSFINATSNTDRIRDRQTPPRSRGSRPIPDGRDTALLGEDFPLSNDSMALAIAKRGLRDTIQTQHQLRVQAETKWNPTRWRRGPLFRAAVQALDTSLRGQILSRSVKGKGKRAVGYWTYWYASPDSPRVAINISAVKARDVKLKNYVVAEVSRHAQQRLLQRLRTTDLAEAMMELKPVVDGVLELRADPPYEQDFDIRISTEHGAAVLLWDRTEDTFLVMTWLHRDSMNEAYAEFDAKNYADYKKYYEAGN